AAPSTAKATFWPRSPGRRLGAPVTTVCGVPCPYSTTARTRRSALGWGLISRISPTNSLSRCQVSPMCSTFATSNPAMVSRWMRSSRGMVISTKSFSQLSGTRMDTTLYSNHQDTRGVLRTALGPAKLAGQLAVRSTHAQHLAQLFQEAQVITEEIANIVDAVFQHG